MQLREGEVVTYVARVATSNCRCGEPAARTVIVSAGDEVRHVALCPNHYSLAWSKSAELRKLDPLNPSV